MVLQHLFSLRLVPGSIPSRQDNSLLQSRHNLMTDEQAPSAEASCCYSCRTISQSASSCVYSDDEYISSQRKPSNPSVNLSICSQSIRSCHCSIRTPMYKTERQSGDARFPTIIYRYRSTTGFCGFKWVATSSARYNFSQIEKLNYCTFKARIKHNYDILQQTLLFFS